MGYLNDTTPFEMHGGFLLRTSRPGLGIDVNEEAVRAAAKLPHQTLNPTWRNEDGSLAEW
jgi:galactonate dehydratase